MNRILRFAALLAALLFTVPGYAHGEQSHLAVPAPRPCTADSCDDGPALTAAWAWATRNGRALQLLGATYNVYTPIAAPTDGVLYGNVKTVLQSHMSVLGPGGFYHAVIYASVVSPGAYVTTLVSPAQDGATTIYAAALPPTTPIWITIAPSVGGNFFQTVQVTAAANTGGVNALTLARPIRWGQTSTSAGAFGVGALVRDVIPNQNIRVYGNGMLMTGTSGAAGDRFVELGVCQSCLVQDVRADGSGGGMVDSIPFSFDNGGNDNEFRNIWIDGGGTAIAGIALEGTVNGRIVDSWVQNLDMGSSAYGIFVTDCIGCVADAHVTRAGVGVGVVSQSSSPTHTASNVRVSGTYDFCSYGAIVDLPNTTIANASFTRNLFGITVAFGASASTPTIAGAPLLLSSVKGESNAAALLTVYAGDVAASGVTSHNDGAGSGLAWAASAAMSLGTVRVSSGNVYQVVAVSGDALTASSGGPAGTGAGIVDNDVIWNYLAPAVETTEAIGLTSTSTLKLVNSSIALDLDVQGYGIYSNGSGLIILDDVSFSMPTSPTAASGSIVLQGASVVHAARVSISGGRYGMYAFGNGATWWRSTGVTYSGVAVASETVVAGSYNACTPSTLSGTSTVSVAWPAIAKGNVVLCQRTMARGTGAMPPVVTVAAGTGYTLTGSTAVDGDVYTCCVQ